MSESRVGVVGVGHIGKNHARVYSEMEGAQLAAVYDVNPEAASAVAEQFGTKAAASLDEFASLVDAASVCTPTPDHYISGCKLLGLGKHLLIEKPITENTQHARELAELAHASSLVLQVGHVERFNPVLDALERLLTRPRFIESHRLSPYPNRSTEIGVVLDLMIHDIEVILHLVRSPITSVDAVGVPVLSKGEDIANARIRFENGCVANITVSRISPERMRKIRVFQEDAYLSLDYQNQQGEIYRKGPAGIERDVVPIEKAQPLEVELRAFVECARTGRRPAVSGHEAAEALDLALKITRQIEEANRANPFPQP
jgi:predicted dehydrogenase